MTHVCTKLGRPFNIRKIPQQHLIIVDNLFSLKTSRIRLLQLSRPLIPVNLELEFDFDNTADATKSAHSVATFSNVTKESFQFYSMLY